MGLRTIIGRQTIRRGYFFEKAAPHNEVRAFMSLIRPIVCEHALIRIGSAYDGGYLVPDDLEGIAACFSPGVKDSSDFENSIAARNIPCFLADFSVDCAPIVNALFDFEKKFVGAVNDHEFMTLDSWVDRKAPRTGDLLLQMDIEGYEYETLLSMSESLLRRFRIMVIEFHSLDGILCTRTLPLITSVFRKILQNFEVVHIHPNNCRPPVLMGDLSVPPVMEFTFLRKDRIQNHSRNLSFPHLLDRPNKPNIADVSLPNCWYQ